MKKLVAAAAVGMAALAWAHDAHPAASSVAVLFWAAVTAGLITMRSGSKRRWRPARRRPMSDEELRELVGIRPRSRPAT